VFADVRRGHRDDLPAVRRVGQRLLITGHPGVEDHLAERLAVRTNAVTAQRGAVLQDEQGGLVNRSGQLSVEYGRDAAQEGGDHPARQLHPARGVLRLLDAPADVTASAGAAGSYRVRCPGAPGVSGCRVRSPPDPGRRTDIRSATPASEQPGLTIARCTTRSAVSSPVMPNAASAHSDSWPPRMRGVVGGHAVDGGRPGRGRSSEVLGAQRGLTEHRVVARRELVGQQQVVRRDSAVTGLPWTWPSG